MSKREQFIRTQLLMLKATTTYMLRTLKEERFTILDEKDQLKQEFLNDEAEDFGLVMTVTTREKVHAISYRILQDIRNWKIPKDSDVKRLRKLICIHMAQLRKMEAINLQTIKTFYFDMFEAVEQSVRWLKILKEATDKHDE